MTAVVMIPGLHTIFKVQTLSFTQLFTVYGLAGIEYTSDSVIESNLGKSREIELDLQI